MPGDPIFSNLSDETDFAELIQDFVSGLRSRTQAIEKAMDGGDLAEVVRLAHQLKGAGGSYGFEPIGQAAAALESTARASGSAVELRHKIDELVDFCRRATPRL